ncbi:DinB family protein [Salana multivorans]|uniref:DinB family protein n=1 Tax=Salana multivorans TaxID=120377 RepID=A0A3N2D9Y8_9MICO|nr:maleylpyruvate isomerase N-terminal domain-containing protein [Salana multivorans]ROR96607.1 DinB family protein [Salana multivorans]
MDEPVDRQPDGRADDHSGAPDWAAVHDACLDATIALAASLTPEQLASAVPATPRWSVHDVLAHAAGVASDVVAGRMDGAPGPAWTARHVAERADRTVADLIEELAATRAAVAAVAAGTDRPAVVWDRSVHLADLHEALGLGVPPDPTWRPVLASAAPGLLAGLPLSVACAGRTYGAGGPEVTVDAYELVRALFSRRSRRQVREWAGPTPSDDELDALAVFGPREDDQPRP